MYHRHLEEQGFSFICLSAKCLGKEVLRYSRKNMGASLVAQWLRIRQPMQKAQVRALVREDPTCRRAAKPMRHNY